MKQTSVTEFITEQLGEESDDWTNFFDDDAIEELMDTGSVEIELNSDITIRVVTHCEVVSKEPESQTPDY